MNDNEFTPGQRVRVITDCYYIGEDGQALPRPFAKGTAGVVSAVGFDHDHVLVATDDYPDGLLVLPGCLAVISDEQDDDMRLPPEVWVSRYRGRLGRVFSAGLSVSLVRPIGQDEKPGHVVVTTTQRVGETRFQLVESHDLASDPALAAVKAAHLIADTVIGGDLP